MIFIWRKKVPTVTFLNTNFAPSFRPATHCAIFSHPGQNTTIVREKLLISIVLALKRRLYSETGSRMAVVTVCKQAKVVCDKILAVSEHWDVNGCCDLLHLADQSRQRSWCCTLDSVCVLIVQICRQQTSCCQVCQIHVVRRRTAVNLKSRMYVADVRGKRT